VRALRANPNTALKSGSTRTGRERRSIGGVLVIGQIAMTVVLLVAAGLLTRTVVRIVSAERGFRAEDALTLRLMLTQTIAFEANDRAPFINRLVSELRGIPGVTAAGVGSDLPPAGTQISMTIKIVTDTRAEVFDLSYAAATPGYLEALGATIVAGRLFEDRDRLSDVPPAVVTESAARMMFQGRDAVGREWPAPLVGPAKTRVRPRVIGVIKDIKYGGLDRAAPATLFAPWEKLAPGTAHLVIRTTRPVAEMAPAIGRTVVQLDPTLPLRPVQTLDEVVSESMATRRLRLQLAAAFALLALALASVALWGAVAQSVLDRRRELAVRLALGATHRDAVRLMVRRGVAFVAVGILIGAGAGALAARTLRHLLHGVSAADPVSFALAIGIAAVVSLVACYVPARRAASISPAELLREA
jgi:putative ABC transport system permease protein